MDDNTKTTKESIPMSHNPTPSFKRPKKIENSRKFLVTLDVEEMKQFRVLEEYMKEIIRVPGVSMASVIRTALDFYKKYLDHRFVETLVETEPKDMDTYEAFRLFEKKRHMTTNQITNEGGN
jgi:hypothetical protein